MSETTGETTITSGLVIKDAQGNEFVWIPVTKTLQNSYSYAQGYLEPAEVEEDAGKGYNFTSEYQAMVTSVNNNDGFYIGRYETTTDPNSKICSKYNTPILTSINWYTLYEMQKGENVNVSGKNINVQTAMIYGVLWDETMAFISQNDTNYEVDGQYGQSIGTGLHDGTICIAGKLNAADYAMNIWGLSSCYSEWTQESALGRERVGRSLSNGEGGGAAIRRNNENWNNTLIANGVYTPSGRWSFLLGFSPNYVCFVKF